MRYPYTRIGPTVPLRPYLRIFLRNQYFTTPPLYGLVDSGADYSIFPYALATEYLKLDLAKSEIWRFQGTTGITQYAWLATVEINIMAENKTDIDFQFKAQVGFCQDFRFGGGVLLGHKDLCLFSKPLLISRKISLK